MIGACNRLGSSYTEAMWRWCELWLQGESNPWKQFGRVLRAMHAGQSGAVKCLYFGPC